MLVDAQGANGNAVFVDWGRDLSTVYLLTVDLSQLQWRSWSIPIAGGTPRLLFAFDSGKQTGASRLARMGVGCSIRPKLAAGRPVSVDRDA